MPATISITLDDAALAALRVALASSETVIVPPVDPKPTDPGPVVVPTDPPIPDFTNTKRMTIAWGDYSRHYSKDIGGLLQHDCLIVKFTVPMDAKVSTQSGRIYSAEWIDGGARRIACLSKAQGEFSGTSLGLGSMSEGTSIGCYFVVGPRTKYNPGLVPGETYYWNVKQAYPEPDDVPCNLFVALGPP